MIKRILLGERELAYDLQRKRVKNLNLRIRADGRVTLSAPPSVSLSAIESFLHAKSRTILQTLDRFEARARELSSQKDVADGKSCCLLGREYTLQVIKGAPNGVVLSHDAICMTLRNPEDAEQRQRVMEQWKKELCMERVKAICDSVYPKFAAYGIPYPTLRVRRMTSRWGSCLVQKGILTFNVALIEYPEECIEYVVVHEMTHFLQPDHSKRFYQLMETVLPDWEARKRILG